MSDSGMQTGKCTVRDLMGDLLREEGAHRRPNKHPFRPQQAH